MKILFSTLYGSNLYGFATPESDKDIKHVVLPNIKDLILGKGVKNKVKKSASSKEYVKNGPDDTDEEYIPIQVFAKDVMEGQTYALELVWAVEYIEAEQKVYDPEFVRFCRELRERFTTSNMTAMIGYAVNQANLYSAKGERLNAAEDLLDLLDMFEPETKMLTWINSVKQTVQRLVQKYPKYIQLTEYSINPQGDMRPCIKILEKTLPYSATFATNVATIRATINKYGDRAKAATIDQVDWKATSHALRIINEGITLLSGKPLIYPYDKEYSNYLLAIKRGQIDHTIVMAEISTNIDKLKEIQLTCNLPEKSQELQLKMEDWLFDWLCKFYELDIGWLPCECQADGYK